ncbi:MAG: protein phosphatase 2C domain-containing protein [Clostridia bacterium]|nr:protein phosphatase 2C domain-containing protein [Clostridia bacterium]
MKWNCCHASVQGESHRNTGTPCQDRTWSEEYGGVTAVALSDGAGSAEYSAAGAEMVVRTVCFHITRRFDRIISNPDGTAVSQEILSILRHALTKKAEELGTDLSQLACTLLAAGIKDGQAFLIHIGDGVIGYTDDCTGKVGVLSEPDNGRYITHTTFVTSPDAIEKMRLFRCSTEKIGGFIFMSDGSAESLYRRQDNHLNSVLNPLTLLAATQSSESTGTFLEDYLCKWVIPRTDDDCSLLIAAQRLTGERCLNMTRDQQRAVYGTDSLKACIRISNVLRLCLESPRTVKQICRLTHVRKKAARRRLKRLTACGVLRYGNGRYCPTSSA